MSLYDEVKYKLIPRDKFRGWRFHAKNESNIIYDAKADNERINNHRKLDDFFKKSVDEQ